MSGKGQLLQDPFLNTLRKEHVPVSIYLVNGIKLQGQIESFDQYVVLLKNSVTQMVYKHAISTVVPSRPVTIPFEHSETVSRPRFEAAPRGRGVRRPVGGASWLNLMFERPEGGDSALLVSLDFGERDYADSTEELCLLVNSAAASVVGMVRGKRQRPDPATFAGRGKVEEMAAQVRAP